MLIPDIELIIARTSGPATASLRVELPNRRADLIEDVPIALNDEVLRSLLIIPDAYAGALTGMVFVPPLREAWQRALGYAEGAGERLRVRLHLRGDDTLHALRWELLRDPVTQTPLAYRERVAFSRYLSSGHLGDVQAATKPRLGAVIAVSSAAGPNMAPVDVAGEVKRAVAALGNVPATVLDGRDGHAAASLPALADALRSGPQLLYLVCHGVLVDGQPLLYLERLPGEPARPIPGAELVRQIADLTQRPLLVVLASCRSGGDSYATLAAVGPQLARSGVGAVLAMQGDVPMELVAELTPRLLSELDRDGQIDRALAAARAALPADQPWWMPTLWMAVKDGALWRTPKAASPMVPSFQHYSLPPQPVPLVHRGGHDQLRQQLIQQPNIAQAIPITAIIGAGGAGKTMQALALAYDPVMQEHFSGGIFWATLGSDAADNIRSTLGRWLRQLGDPLDGTVNVVSMTQRLRELLAEKAALVIIDDVWRPADLEPFLIIGSQGRLLVTARNAEFVGRTSTVHEIKAMSRGEAMQLLEEILARPLFGDERKHALELAKMVSYEPLALTVLAGQLRGTDDWLILADEYRTVESGGTRLIIGPDSRVARASLTVAVRRLKPDERSRFAWLGTLREDSPVTLTAAAVLWDVAPGIAELTLHKLVQMRLVQVQEAGAGTDGDGSVYRLHDLAREAALRLLSAPLRVLSPTEIPGMGVELPDAHMAIITRYRARTQQGLWHTLPDDGYIYRNLAWHMHQADDSASVDALFCEPNAEGYSGWFMTLERNGTPEAFIQQVDDAWDRLRLLGPYAAPIPWLDDHTLEKHNSLDLGRLVSYALLKTSVVSVAKAMDPNHFVQLCQHGQYTPKQALMYALRAGEEAVLRLIPLLDKSALHLLVDQFPAFHQEAQGHNGNLLGKVLQALGSRLAEWPELTNWIFESVLRSAPVADWATLLAQLGIIPESHQVIVVDQIGALPPGRPRRQALTAILPLLTSELALNNALSAVAALSSLEERIQVFAATLPNLISQPAMAVSVGRAVLAIIRLLPEEFSTEEQAERRRYNEDIPAGGPRREKLCNLFHVLPAALRAEAVALIPGFTSTQARAEIIRDVSSSPEGVVNELLGLAQDLQGELCRRTLVHLAPHLAGEQLQEAAALAARVSDAEERWEALRALAPRFTDTQERQQQVRAALAASSGWKEGRWLAVALAKQGHVNEGLALAAMIPDRDWQASAYGEIAQHLCDDQQRQQALDSASAIADERARADALAQLIPHLTSTQLEQVIEIAFTLGRPSSVANLLCRAIPRLKPTTQQTSVERLIHELGSWDEELQAWVIKDLASTLARLAPGPTLALAMALTDASQRLEALTPLALAEGEQRTGTIEAILDGLHQFPRQHARYVPGWLGSVMNAEQQERACSWLIDELADEVQRREWPYILWSLSKVAAAGSPELRRRIVARGRDALLRDAHGDEVSQELCTVMGSPKPEEVRCAFVLACMTTRDRHRSTGLDELVSILPSDLWPDLLDETAAIQAPEWQKWLLSVIAPRIPAVVLPRAFALAYGLPEEYGREDVLLALAKRARELAVEAGQVPVLPSLGDEIKYLRAMLALAESLPLEQRTPVLHQTLTAPWSPLVTGFMEQALPRLAANNPTLIGEIMAAAWRLPHSHSRLRVLVKLARDQVLVDASHIQPPFIKETLELARSLTLPRQRALALGSLLALLPRDVASGVCDEALAAAAELASPTDQASCIVQLAVEVDELWRAQIIVAAQRVLSQPGVQWREGLLADLGSVASGNTISEILQAIIASSNQRAVAESLATIVPALQLPDLHFALTAVRSLDRSTLESPHLSWSTTTISRSIDKVLGAIAQRFAMLALPLESVHTAGLILSPEVCSEAIIAIAPSLPLDSLHQVFTLMRWKEEADEALEELARCFAAYGEVSTALMVITLIKQPWRQVSARTRILPLLPVPHQEETLTIITGQIADIHTWALIKLVPILAPFFQREYEQLWEAMLHIAQREPAIDTRARLLLAMLSTCPTTQKSNIRQLAMHAVSQAINGGPDAQALLEALIPQLTAVRLEEMPQILDQWLRIVADGDRAKLLGGLGAAAPLILGIGGPKGVQDTLKAMDVVQSLFPSEAPWR